MNEEETIEKPWCTYGWFLGAENFGKVVKDYGSAVEILYSEGQLYSPECWNSKWVERFPTLIEAVEHYIKTRPETDIRERRETQDKVRWRARRDFQSYFNKLLPVVTSNQLQPHPSFHEDECQSFSNL